MRKHREGWGCCYMALAKHAADHERRSAIQRRVMAARTPAERTAIALKVWTTRRANAAKKGQSTK